MPSFTGLQRNIAAATRYPAEWRLAREAIVKRRAMQHVDELAPFARLVRTLRPRVVIEIGTAKGGVFWMLCRLAAPDACLISLDLPPNERFSGGKKQPIDLQATKLPGQTVHVVHGDSHANQTLERTCAILAGRSVDLLFIDGDHTYEGVKSDFTMYQPLVRPGGLIAFHDIVETHWEACNVDRFWAELMTQTRFNPRAIVSRHRSHFGGIGLLNQPPPSS